MNLINRKGQVLLADDTAANFAALLQAAIAQGISLNDADFSNQLIENITIENVSLSKARLDNTQFSHVKFNHVLFDECIINQATFCKTDFLDCRVEDCKLYRNQFLYCKIKNTDFVRAHCYDNYFKNCLLTNSNFQDVFFGGNTFRSEKESANARHTKLGFHKVKFVDANATANVFTEILIKGCTFKKSKFASTKFNGAIIEESKFDDTNFSYSCFHGTTFSKTKFKHDVIEDLRIFQSVFKNCTFNIKAIINMATLGTTYSTCQFTFPGGRRGRVTFETCLLEKSKFVDSKFPAGLFTSCSLDDSDFSNADMDNSHFNYCMLYGTKLDLTQQIRLVDCQTVEALTVNAPEEPSRSPIVISSDDEDDEMDED